jgi:hypothetical protein
MRSNKALCRAAATYEASISMPYDVQSHFPRDGMETE